MAQKSGAVNYLIHDANGQPQMIKVVQSTNAPAKQPVSQLQLNSTSGKVMFKVPGAPEANQQAPVYRTVKVTGIKSGSKIVQVPIQTLASLQKTATEAHGSPSGQQKKVQTPSVSGYKIMSPTVSSQASPVEHSPAASHSKRHAASPYVPHNIVVRKRRDQDGPPQEYTSKRRKAADKVGKGLRHFSMKVCEKVRSKGFTSYNEVADELVAEFAAGIHGTPDSQHYDQKNIRRRVYDALNVLMAMNIISKEKKEIRWLGLPTNSVQEYTALEKDKAAKIESIQQKQQLLHELLLQQISFKSLVERNRAAENRGVKPSPASAIHLPFIVVNTSDNALIDCSISTDKTEYMFNFDKKFQIIDDMDILKKMGLLLGIDKGECTEENLQLAKSMVPKSLGYYLEQLCRGAPLTHVKVEPSDDEDEGEGGGEGEEDEEEELEDEEEGPSSDDDSTSDVDVN